MTNHEPTMDADGNAPYPQHYSARDRTALAEAREDREHLAESKAKFDDQADELEGHLNEIGRRAGIPPCAACDPHPAHAGRCFATIAVGRAMTDCGCKERAHNDN